MIIQKSLQSVRRRTKTKMLQLAALATAVAVVMAFCSSSTALAQELGIGSARPSWCPSQFKTIVALGDSTTDTGNYVNSISGTSLVSAASSPPYGETYFDHPTGRFSDGRMMVDVVAQALHHELLPPHIGRSGNLTEGSQNFAVAGATALGKEKLASVAGGAKSVTPLSLGEQVKLLLESTVETGAFLFVGEIGGNDYNYAFAGGMKAEQVIKFVPEVVAEVGEQLDMLLSERRNVIKKVVILGQFPLGCISDYLIRFGDDMELDGHGCVAAISAVTDLHDRLLLQGVVPKVRRKYAAAGVDIVFFDLGSAYLHVLDHAAGFGFQETVQPCYQNPANSSAVVVTPCTRPAAFISWDGRHLTDSMHRTLVSLFLYSPQFAFPFPNFLTPCV